MSTLTTTIMTESENTSPTSTTPSSTDYTTVNGKMVDKISYRKSTKPMMEKKRRARINNCLSQLKSLVLQAMKKDNSQYSKLEKADILELTVKHLKHIQRIQAPNTNPIPEALSKYRAGFNECANEVIRYLGETHGVNNEARTRILSHLSSLLSPVNTIPIQQVQPSHPHILPAPAPSVHHQLQQQEMAQHKLHVELLQHNQQQHIISGFPGQHSETPSSLVPVPDFNNNNSSAVNLSNTIRNNTNTTPAANKNTIFNMATLPHGGVIKSETGQLVSDPTRAFHGLNVTASSAPPPSFHLPSISTTPAVSMATTAPFQLVHSTLPNGQVALLLAPQPVPAMNVYATHNNAIPNQNPQNVHIINNQQLHIKQQQQQQSQEHSSNWNQTPKRQEQHQQLHKPRVISPVSRHESPISLVVDNRMELTKSKEDNEPSAFESRVPHSSAFRHPSSSPCNSFPNTAMPTEFSSMLKMARTPNGEVANRASDSPPFQSRCAIPSPVEAEHEMPSSSNSPSRDETVRSPEDVTSVRDLFEYKMAKRNRQTNVITGGKSTWRPW